MTPPRKRKPARTSTARPAPRSTHGFRRLFIAVFTAGVVALQATSCGTPPGAGPAQARPPAAPSTSTSTSAATTNAFASCPQHFAGGLAPVTPAAPSLRALCFDAFAVLHSGATRTPVYVAERLNRQTLRAGDGLKRTDLTGGPGPELWMNGNRGPWDRRRQQG